MMTTPPPNRPALDMADNDLSLQDRHQAGVLVITLLLFVACAFSAVRDSRRVDWPLNVEPANVGRVLSGVDPNTASWSDLLLLPGIGESRAKSIVAYRHQAGTTSGDDGVAFHCSGDLRRIKGIGGKTVRRLQPCLRFDDDGGY